MSITRKLLISFRQDGFLGTGRRGTLYVLRRFSRHVNAWISRLETTEPSLEDDEIESRNEPFRNCHQGRRCFVIGNGPSLSTQDLRPLANELTFVMNAFWKHPILELWQPVYYFFADPVLFDGSKPVQSFFSDLRASIRTATFFVPASSETSVSTLHLLPIEQTYFVHLRGSLKDSLHAPPDLARSIPGVQSTSQFAIMAAMYMGCSPIYLLGLDHDWLTHRGMDRHFYAGRTIEGHATADSDLSKVSYKSDMEAQLNLWYGYEALKTVADAGNIRILNATNGGFLDVFERADYESVIRQVPE